MARRRAELCQGRHPPEETVYGRYRAHFDCHLCGPCYSQWRRLGSPQQVVDGDTLHRQRNSEIDVRAEPAPDEFEDEGDDGRW